MGLAPGTRIGPYEVIGPIGAGGMGEVYQARDMNLDRDVALKILPDEFADDAERLQRFEREAKALAALNHPNIAQVYGLEGARNGTADLTGSRAIAMEFVEGPTLEEAIGAELSRRTSPVELVEWVLPIARQIADALEVAHERGIVHRDLKPANIKVSSHGQVKVLDFGLAKAMEASPASGSVSESPTLTARSTQLGMIIGTAAYMSPEQARGKPVDRRADIWAFGAVLYEMLTGARAFAGEEITDVLAKVIERDPDFDRLPAATPPAISRLLSRCLTKDPKRRLRDIGEAKVILDDVIEGRIDAPSTPSETTGSSGRRGARLPWAVAGALAVLSVFLLTRLGAPTSRDPQSVSAALNLPADVEFFAKPSISADGRVAAFVGVSQGRRRIYVRRLDDPEMTPLEGSDAANLGALAPDGESVAIVTTEGVLSRLSLDGTVAQQLTDADFTASATWGADGRIVFGRDGALWAIAADGGIPEALTSLDEAAGEVAHRFPVVSNDGAFLFFNSYSGSSSEEVRLNVLDLRSGTRSVLLDDESQAIWASPDQLLMARDAALYRAAFQDGQLTGTPARVHDDLAYVATGGWGAAVSDTGTLLTAGEDVSRASLVWVSMEGVETPLPSGVRAYSNPRLSPDGRHVAFSQDGGIWTLDIARNAFTRVASVGRYPIWIDASRLAFRQTLNLAVGKADGTTLPETLADTGFGDYPASTSPDGRTIAVVRINPTTSGDVYLISVDGDEPPRAFISTTAYEGGAQFSPDGQWIAYTSDDSGRTEVYLAPYPSADQRFPVSSGGGLHPTWGPDGRRIFYRSGQRMMAVSVTLGTDNTVTPRFEPARMVFERQYKFGPNLSVPHYSLSDNGPRFLMVKEEPGARWLELITNWTQHPER